MSEEAQGSKGGSYTITLAVVIALAFIGFFTGIRSGDYEAVDARPEPVTQSANIEGLQPALSYTEIGQRQLGPNRAREMSLSDLEYELDDPFALERATDVALSEAVIRRTARRAFDGAPPVVPHPIDQGGAIPCLSCHGDGLVVDNIVAPMMSHTVMPNCTQCHVEEQSDWMQWERLLERATDVPNDFVGLEAPEKGDRAWAGAPPTIPHTLHMRDNCASCHGLLGQEGIRSSHPWRQSCTQCHVPEGSTVGQWSSTAWGEREESVPPWAATLQDNEAR